MQPVALASQWQVQASGTCKPVAGDAFFSPRYARAHTHANTHTGAVDASGGPHTHTHTHTHTHRCSGCQWRITQRRCWWNSCASARSLPGAFAHPLLHPPCCSLPGAFGPALLHLPCCTPPGAPLCCTPVAPLLLHDCCCTLLHASTRRWSTWATGVQGSCCCTPKWTTGVQGGCCCTP